MFDLTNWKLVSPFGTNGLIFKKGNHRIIIDKQTREIIVAYKFK